MAGQASSMRPILQQIVTAGPRQSRLLPSPLAPSPLVPSPLGRTAPLTSSPPTKTRRPLLRLELSLNTVCSSSRPVRLVDIPPTPRTPVSTIFTALPDVPFSPISAALSESEPELEEPRSACTRAAMEAAAYRTGHLRIDPQSIRIEGEHPHSRGSFGEVWRGSMVGKTGDLERVAVKKIHLRSGDDRSNQRLLRHLLREVVPWYELEHPNITPFIGYIFDGHSARMVSKWQEGGNVKEIKKSLKCDPVGALRLAHQVASGLAYLHSRNPPIVHGDMKPDNILIGADGVARLVDFGLSMILDDTLSPGLRTSDGCRNTLIYADPLLLDEVPRTIYTDLWALGWIIYELVTSRSPYYPLTSVNAICKAIITYKLPTRDTHPIPYPSLLWPVLEACWSKDLSRRWSAEKIASHLMRVL